MILGAILSIFPYKSDGFIGVFVMTCLQTNNFSRGLVWIFGAVPKEFGFDCKRLQEKFCH
jgi:hypothetical protein